MQVLTTAINEVKLIIPRVYEDERGYFFESWQQQRFADMIAPVTFVQDNQSLSKKGTLRGLHWQEEHPQDKLISVLSGAIFDVAVDIRPESPTYGKWVGETLSAENHRQLFIPKGFAHGFYVLSETAIVSYKCSDFYHPESERSIRWDDPNLAIEWPIKGPPLLSAKDALAAPFKVR
ncbi:dTDP-4-dehydrorhamnose 3,5-epimerase [Shewanella litorisediminis]|uniref:dTDP-4-dehydrorhamnose 3,5-epimerase n=1 Tax=Shewanella litorisediminis TaxID=1173586 RepID=A0ABX7FZN7_9GAMM|nr:dTDP-4-dehydrorhamnose 3,5-epimerase [Shewanella litorisediminis]MCL2919620.1 dTDP-4-dehydrorhamnose 3,5-epimerase [Shewanella litorisediminis]QRH00512.1 dTDP-4-dehydrorhamnose 3,5-epimerase [Shewanella litorisediminis]